LNTKNPPKLAQWLLHRFYADKNDFTSIGDFEEVYNQIAQENGKVRARIWYWLQTMLSMKSIIIGNIYWRFIMFTNYLKIAVRNFKRHKGYSFINVAGLGIGMACCILIIAYVLSELSYDKYHKNANRIYRICSDLKIGDNVLNIPKTSPRIMETLQQNFPEIKNVVRLNRMSKTTVKYNDIQFFENRIFYADNSIFDVFTFPLINGDKTSALVTAHSVVITQQIAERYFGDEDPLGKILTIDNEDNYKVTGVIENISQNSHFIFDMLCSFETHYANNVRRMDDWFNVNYRGYILFKEMGDINTFEKKVADLIDSQLGDLLEAVGGEIGIYFQPLARIHLHSHLLQEISANGDIAYVYIFSAISLFILLIACINFTNLSTARSLNRAREVGLRKVLGADRTRLIRQFLSESMLYSFGSLLIACVLVLLALPLFKSLTGIELSAQLKELHWFIAGFLGLTLLVGIIAGSYPAFFLSAFKPNKVLRGTLSSGTTNLRFRNILVVVQFIISVVLIVSTATILKQLNFMKDQKLGFNKEQVVVIPIRGNSIFQARNAVKEELKSYNGVINVALSSHVPGETTFKNPFIPEGFTDEQSIWMGELTADQDYFTTMGIEIKSGRNFSSEFSTDADLAILVNEAAVNRFGWENPVGKKIRVFTGPGSSERIILNVIGVVKDFHLTSLHEEIEPLIIANTARSINTFIIRISPQNMSETLAALENIWRKFEPNFPFDYFFLDESFDSQYRADEKLSRIFSYFTFLAIFIACLGLFGLASFTAEQRTKEIGIRKVLGASISSILLLLSKEFTKWVLIANIFAWPIAYFLMNKWLQGFAYRTSLHLTVFGYSTLLALLIAMFTVSFQAIRAAQANPVDSLKYE